MKCLGLIGGIGWEATALYYRFINEEVRRRLGSLHTARLLVNSLEFEPIDTAVKDGQWNDAGEMMAVAAQNLEKAGAEGLIICSNLMHFVAPQVEVAVKIPLLHVGDAINRGVRGVSPHIGLLGTRFTLEHGFLLDRKKHPRCGTTQIHVPSTEEANRLDRIIYMELCRGVIDPDSAAEVLRIAKGLRSRGAKRVVLASAELGLLFPPGAALPDWIFQSTELHAEAALRWALGEDRPVDRTSAALSAEAGGNLVKRSERPELRRGTPRSERRTNRKTTTPVEFV